LGISSLPSDRFAAWGADLPDEDGAVHDNDIATENFFSPAASLP
jgi:hypothetical protein